MLQQLLRHRRVLHHSFVVGELAMGSLHDRQMIIDDLLLLPMAIRADDDEVLAMVDRLKIYAGGIGYLDAHLLASVQLTAGASLWTRDRRLHSIAEENGLAFGQPERLQ
jgi:predicted nucleic acid-binding protein